MIEINSSGCCCVASIFLWYVLNKPPARKFIFRIEISFFSPSIFKINLFDIVTSAANIWNILRLTWQKCHQFVTEMSPNHHHLRTGWSLLLNKIDQIFSKFFSSKIFSPGLLTILILNRWQHDSDLTWAKFVVTWFLTCHVISFS